MTSDHGAHRRTLRKLRRERETYKDRESDAVLAARADGMAQEDIAHELGRRRNAIYRIEVEHRD